jgi:small-conductance mechanosensitive channel
MDALSVFSALCATAASAFFGLRAQMLKPSLRSWPDAPAAVAWVTIALSIILGCYVVAVVDGYRATTGEAAILFVLAVYAGLLFGNLLRQVRGHGGDA